MNFNCHACGESNPSENRYCKKCGADLSKYKMKDKGPHRTAILVGWFSAFFFTPLGFVMGLYLLSREEAKAKKNGWWVFGLSTAFLIIGLILFI